VVVSRSATESAVSTRQRLLPARNQTRDLISCFGVAKLKVTTIGLIDSLRARVLVLASKTLSIDPMSIVLFMTVA
jgi:hypothetical protein